MKNRLFSITAFFVIVIIMVTGILYVSGAKTTTQDNNVEHILAVNEIEQLAKAGQLEEMAAKAAALQEDMRMMQVMKDNRGCLFLMCGICILFLLVVFGYVYIAILRPFDKMRQFAGEIAKGNFEVPLNYERSNYFGAFTWAFDSMRREITKARACEKEAIENNKTVIATLSHDIKTPIASIRAYAEGLEANLDDTMQKRQRYVSVIMKKCDEVAKLTNDLFLHSLSDLDKLKITSEPVEICSFLETVLDELSGEQEDVKLTKADFTANVDVDKNRLTQIVENLINNARKYAKTDIHVTLTPKDNQVEIAFRDYGTGIPDEDMPFIFDKFYRGRNCGSEQGSGLGLYIVKYIAEQMGGSVKLHNYTDGLEVTVTLPLVVS